MALHNAMTGSNNHQSHALTYATATARLAATTLVAGDVGKIALQQSDNTFWVLVDHSPITWAQVTHGFIRVSLDATSGLVQATYNLDAILPTNATIVRAWYDVLTTFTSATDAATIELGVATDDTTGIVAAIAISDLSTPWTAGFHDAVPDGTAANFTTKTTGARRIIADVQVEDLTDGLLNLWIEYQVSAA